MAEAPARPPRAPRSSVAHEAFGERWEDPYDWLRDPGYPKVERPEILDHLRAENAFFEALMAPRRRLIDALEAEFRGRIQDEDASPPSHWRGHWTHWTFEAGAQYRKWWRRAEGEAEPSLLLDEPTMAAGLDYFKLADFEIDHGGELLAYGIDDDGSERCKIRVERLSDRGSALNRPIENASGATVWAVGRPVLLYVELSEQLRPYRVRARDLGDPEQPDRILYEETDPAFFVSLARSRSDRFLTIQSSRHGTSETRFVPADRPFEPWTVVREREDDHEYEVDDDGARLVILTNDVHVNFRLVEADPASPGEWRELEAGSDRRYLRGVACFRDFRATLARVDGLPVVTIETRGGERSELPFEEEVFAVGFAGNPDFETERLRVSYSSMRTPASILEWSLADRRFRCLKRQEIPSGYARERYVAKRLFARTADGAQAPISLVHRDDYPTDGSGKLILYGYGAYGLGMPASFSANRLSLLDRGFCFAIAHVRGGDEMGYGWYLDGKLENKANTFSDFVACAETLIANGYGKAGEIAIMGGSAGGLLVGAVLNMRPDLWRCALAIVPFVDVLATMRDETLPLTPGEWTEWGDPIRDEAAFRRIRSYSPIDNVEARPYPAILATAGLSDPRVTYWEPAKWVATLRERTTSTAPIALRTNMGAGHFGKSGRYDALRELAEEYAFLIGAFET